jgi:signal transduction histidine kinase
MFFTNLGPGTYTFRVIAANDQGVWNREGATLTFTIPPTFLQSIWFKLILLVLVLALIWIFYELRLRQVTTRMQGRFQARIAERERIARELHDTLLQGFQGLVLQFQAVAYGIPKGQASRKAADEALARADNVLAEGRDRVGDLRTAGGGIDLREAWQAVSDRLGERKRIAFNLSVEGSERALHPLVSEEIERIGTEAIRNAYQHSRAKTVEVVLRYHTRFRLTVRDDGVGLPAEVAEAGSTPGHFGLLGMRERATRIGGILTIVSQKDTGTELSVTLPGRAAYARPNRHGWLGELTAWLHGPSPKVSEQGEE